MPTSSKAIKDYLNQSYRDFRWMKELSDKEIDEEIKALSPVPKFRIPMRNHQKIGFLLGFINSAWYFQYSMGVGKTGIILELINYLLETGHLNKALVCVPTNELVDGWVEEIQKWEFKFPYVPLKGSTDEKWELYKGLDRGVALVPYPSLVYMGSSNVGGGMVVDRSQTAALASGLDCVVYDEITKAGNRETLTFKIASQLAKTAKFRYGLAGRPFGRDPITAWAQFYLIDRGETLTESIGFFREVFFDKKKAYWGGPWSFEYKFKRDLGDDFARIIANSSLRYSADECVDLPEVSEQKIYINLPKSADAYYRAAVMALKKSKGNLAEVKNAFLRMRQISSGFLGFNDDETGEKAQITFSENPKLNVLLELIDEMPPDRKMIVSVDFTYSGKLICDSLKKLKIEHGWLYGGTKNWEDMKKKFDRQGGIRVLIVQSRKGAYGLNLQSANYLVYYESPVSVLDRLQSEARVKRQGQQNKVFQYDLICRGTSDESILRFHKEGKSLYQAIVVNPDEALT